MDKQIFRLARFQVVRLRVSRHPNVCYTIGWHHHVGPIGVEVQ